MTFKKKNQLQCEAYCYAEEEAFAQKQAFYFTPPIQQKNVDLKRKHMFSFGSGEGGEWLEEVEIPTPFQFSTAGEVCGTGVYVSI